MKAYLEICVSATAQQQEMLIPTMIELGCQGFLEEDSALRCYIEKDRWSEEKYITMRSDLQRMLRSISANASITFRELEEENWNEQWERSIGPIEVGSRLLIKPAWHQSQDAGGRIVIQIDPKMSFGTGFHETTRLILCLLEKFVSSGIRILDMGTGTGILAIAAVKLGARSAIGNDIDDWAIDNARENILLNGVENQVTVTKSRLEDLPPGTFDIIAANLTLNTIIEHLTLLKSRLDIKGTLLLSGLLAPDEQTMTRHLTAHHFEIINIPRENNWIAVAARRLV